MPSLKEYRDRISSVKSTRKITSAMKMVAASKLRKAQEQAEASQPYAQAMAEVMARVAEGVSIGPQSPKLLVGTGRDDIHLLVVITSDRGLCGGFNANIIRAAQAEVRSLESQKKTVKLICVGRKGYDYFRRHNKDLILNSYTDLGGKGAIKFSEVREITQFILDEFENDQFDKCTLFYNEFKNVLSQKPASQQLIPFAGMSETGLEKAAEQDNEPETDEGEASEEAGLTSPYDFEPEEEKILATLLPRNLGVQVYRAVLDSAAGEQAARMTAMDNATRNAGDLIDSLTLDYNRARQAHITTELIEIISGAEAL